MHSRISLSPNTGWGNPNRQTGRTQPRASREVCLFFSRPAAVRPNASLLAWARADASSECVACNASFRVSPRSDLALALQSDSTQRKCIPICSHNCWLACTRGRIAWIPIVSLSPAATHTARRIFWRSLFPARAQPPPPPPKVATPLLLDEPSWAARKSVKAQDSRFSSRGALQRVSSTKPPKSLTRSPPRCFACTKCHRTTIQRRVKRGSGGGTSYDTRVQHVALSASAQDLGLSILAKGGRNFLPDVRSIEPQDGSGSEIFSVVWAWSKNSPYQHLVLAGSTAKGTKGGTIRQPLRHRSLGPVLVQSWLGATSGCSTEKLFHRRCPLSPLLCSFRRNARATSSAKRARGACRVVISKTLVVSNTAPSDGFPVAP